MSYSIVIPRIKIIHYSGFRKTGESRYGAFKSFAHYTRGGKFNGKTTRSYFGEPNHYDRYGHSVGFSRRVKPWKVIHFGQSGRPIGFSRCFFWVLWIHHGPVLEKYSCCHRRPV